MSNLMMCWIRTTLLLLLLSYVPHPIAFPHRAVVPHSLSLFGAELSDVVERSAYYDRLKSFITEWKANKIVLDSQGPYTIFAPTASAFDKYLVEHPMKYNNETLSTNMTTVLTYHIIEGYQLTKGSFLGTKLFPTLNSQLLVVSVDPKENMFVNNINVTQTNIIFENVVLHTVDTILIPENAKDRKDTPSIPTGNGNRNFLENSAIGNILYRRKRSAQTENMKVKVRPRRGKALSQIFQIYLRLYSQRRGSAIDGRLPGDLGFDPAGIANSMERLNRLREIELKHARIAMLACIGWPISELFHIPLLNILVLTKLIPPDSVSKLDETGRALTVINGGLLFGSDSAALGLFIFLFSMVEYWLFTNRRSLASKKNGPQPGDFGFDPFNLIESRGSSPAAKFEMKEMELVNGRIAMLSIVVFVISELATGKPIVDVTPYLFHPFWDLNFISR
eukprot:gene5480-11026_t